MMSHYIALLSTGNNNNEQKGFQIIFLSRHAFRKDYLNEWLRNGNETLKQ